MVTILGKILVTADIFAMLGLAILCTLVYLLLTTSGGSVCAWEKEAYHKQCFQVGSSETIFHLQEMFIWFCLIAKGPEGLHLEL